MKTHSPQRGIALFLTLTILLLLTIIGVSSVQTTSMQERMARNFRDVNMAFQGAEAAVREAEDFIELSPSFTTFPEVGEACQSHVSLDGNGLCNSEDGTMHWKSTDWSDGSSDYIQATTTAAQLGAAAGPRYVIEYVAKVTIEQDTLNIGNVGEGGSSGRAYIYRITARGTGGTNQSHAMIQGLYGRQF
ncbi:MAG: PilX N-terminal domain-containing pilus assembly protein [Proteobacteria bacterium]|jgi:type IV pilus assembly protein PilX|nr:PilX N-terminal domain-containing pilus assembly protein [Pseudomonadota bacterium]MDA1302227.1 PilX N-terminal domain-containing pilus assembly protein [Pseudomonadota bacterium]